MENSAFDAIVVGSGAAGFACACRLRQAGLERVAIVTENVNAGASRNTGSDKQTYYKLSLSGEADSVREMARDLFACGCTDGDTALAEAANSVRCFLYLAELGVPFPHTAFGEYPGYKTDHDPHARASSAGPLTSKYMTEALEREANRRGVTLLDGYYVTEILKDENGVCGVLAVHTGSGILCAFRSANVALATGGPAGVYAHSVYPESQTGATSLALRAGASLQNLTEWQYGLASVSPRWNVSGSYMQTLPRFLSVDDSGRAREFLLDYFTSPAEALHAVFLKGYQWPFDAKKAAAGSSRADLAVYTETVLKHRKVYLDYTVNPFGFASPEDMPLSQEAKSYLLSTKAYFGTPIRRLRAMNAPAADLYRNKGVDLAMEPLEIALCAQHCNGGIAVDANWQTEIPGLYAIGECAGTHGVTRPGGSALNAGQVGALRAAQQILYEKRSGPEPERFRLLASQAAAEYETLFQNIIHADSNVETLTVEARERFTAVCAAVRNTARFAETEARIRELLSGFASAVHISDRRHAVHALRLRDALTVQLTMLYSCGDFYRAEGVSRGSAIYTEGAALDFRLSDGADERTIRGIRMRDGRFETFSRPVRPLPETDDSFEVIWKHYRERIGRKE